MRQIIELSGWIAIDHKLHDMHHLLLPFKTFSAHLNWFIKGSTFSLYDLCTSTHINIKYTFAFYSIYSLNIAFYQQFYIKRTCSWNVISHISRIIIIGGPLIWFYGFVNVWRKAIFALNGNAEIKETKLSLWIKAPSRFHQL